MLLRIDFVEEIGRFEKLKHTAEQFGRLTLIFARNGYGKSTLCSVLRSATEGKSSYITARRRLGAKKESRVQSKWTSGTVAFGGDDWNSHPGKIYIFDQTFVHQNLHVGESVTRENKRSLLPVILGEKGVELAQKILDLDKEQRDVDRRQKERAEIIQARCPIVTSKEMTAFCTNTIPDNIADRIAGATRAVQLAKQAVVVQQKQKPKEINLVGIDRSREIAARTIETVAEDVVQRVRQHKERHQLQDSSDRWLKYGIEHLKEPACPFCDQDLAGLDLIDAYQAYFSDAFEALVNDRDEVAKNLELVLSDGFIESLVQDNGLDLAFWSQVCDLRTVPSMSAEDIAAVRSGLQMLQNAFAEKLRNPLSIVTLGDAEAAISAAYAIVDFYNSEICAAGEEIDKVKLDAQAADLPKAQQLLARWVAFSERLSEPVKSAAEGYASAEVRKIELAEEKKIAQEALTSYARQTMEARQSEINNLLLSFGANFSIANVNANFKGREPNTDYAIAIGGVSVGAGEKSDVEPSFGTLLSTGDKNTLALSFFLTQILSDPALRDAVVVFDDPFNSQDMNRQFETASRIREVARKARQTIVLSHDPRFLFMIEKDSEKAMTKAFQLTCNDEGGGAITSWSSEDELKSLYIRQGEMIREYAHQGKLLRGTDINGVLQAIRPFLEDYIRLRFPGRFNPMEHLPAMAEAIRDAGVTDPMYDSVEDLLALNEYTRPNMHGGSDAPEPDALRAQTRKVVKIVGRY